MGQATTVAQATLYCIISAVALDNMKNKYLPASMIKHRMSYTFPHNPHESQSSYCKYSQLKNIPTKPKMKRTVGHNMTFKITKVSIRCHITSSLTVGFTKHESDSFNTTGRSPIYNLCC